MPCLTHRWAALGKLPPMPGVRMASPASSLIAGCEVRPSWSGLPKKLSGRGSRVQVSTGSAPGQGTVTMSALVSL